MVCGCCKDLGCYVYGDTIKFGVKSISNNNDYIFHIWGNGTYTKVNQSFPGGDELVLDFTFNENSETTIKIELPSDVKDEAFGVSFVTTADGACCFTVHGTLSNCQ
jgi:hypothetical protein